MPQPAVVFPQLKPTDRSPPPFVETKEALGGYLVFEADHVDAGARSWSSSATDSSEGGASGSAAVHRPHAQVQLEPDGAATT
jgi:hypothetical protein